MIEVDGLRKLHDSYLAVDNVSFSIGAGKTTTMRCLSGLISATSSSLKIAACCVQSNLNTLKNRLAYVPDDPPLLEDLSVGEHLEFTGRLYRVPDHHDKAIELLQLFELLNKYKAGATALSRGMRQKLAVCCAYLYSPCVILLCKPLTGLAPPPFAPYSIRLLSCLDSCTPVVARDALNLIFRQAISVRHYRFNIAVSLLLPTALCLSSLFTGRIIEQWFYVVGGIALCTILLAPPALRIDFRRGLKRMVLLHSLPVKPFSMVIGQLALPILITWVFELTTLTIAALVIQPGWKQLCSGRACCLLRQF